MAEAKIGVLRGNGTLEIRIHITAEGKEYDAAVELGREMQEHEIDLAELIEMHAAGDAKSYD